MNVVKATKELIALTPEMHCDQTAMGLPPVMSAVFLIAILVKCGCLGGIKRKWYVYLSILKIAFIIKTIRYTALSLKREIKFKST
jgi:hypothetical protein